MRAFSEVPLSSLVSPRGMLPGKSRVKHYKIENVDPRDNPDIYFSIYGNQPHCQGFPYIII